MNPLNALSSKQLWWIYSVTAAIGLLIVTISMTTPETELVQTIVDTVHSAAKAKEGEQY